MSEVDDEMVTVGRFLDPAEGQMAKGALEAEGIEAFLQGENANGLVAMALPTSLLVRRQDEAAAREVLEAAESGESSEAADSAEALSESGAADIDGDSGA